jgi:hypothetical protein
MHLHPAGIGICIAVMAICFLTDALILIEIIGQTNKANPALSTREWGIKSPAYILRIVSFHRQQFPKSHLRLTYFSLAIVGILALAIVAFNLGF